MGNEGDVDPDQREGKGESAQARALTRVGSMLRGKWRLDALLGVGGMAAVYAATHRNGTRAAVKILHRELSLDEGLRKRFMREGQIANMVGHEGVVRVLDDDTAEDGSVYHVTELLEGETLADRCDRCDGRLDEDEVLTIADAILDVLAAAHAKDLVHRDLKPENVFLTTAGQVKVLDFGIARARTLSSETSATRTGSTLGTPAYMAPEQARGLWDEVDGRTDLWGCGATLFRLLSGRLVHTGRTANEELLSAMTNEAPPLASVAPHVSAPVARLVDRALAFDRARRWPDAAAMREAVRNAYEQRHAAPISSAPRPIVPASSVRVTLRSVGSEPGSHSDIGLMDTLATGSAERPASAARATTAGPVSSGVPRPPAAPWLRGPRAIGLAVGGVLFVSGVAWLSVGRETLPSPATASSATTAPSLPTAGATPPAAPSEPATAPAVAPVPIAVPTIAAATAPSASVSAAASGAKTPPAARGAGAKPAADRRNCTPPYVVDPVTGKRNWKLECL
jgi:serine/threonine-protein kinase